MRKEEQSKQGLKSSTEALNSRWEFSLEILASERVKIFSKKRIIVNAEEKPKTPL